MDSTYRTYYRSSAGQPRNGEAAHPTLDAALESWANYACGALLARSGGEAVLIAPDGDLRWIEGAEGGHISGELAEQLSEYGAEELDPRRVAELLAPAPLEVRS